MRKDTAQHPKITVIGAGSLFFGREVIFQMVQSPYLNKGTLALVDIDEERLEKMLKLARMVAMANDVRLRVEGSTDRRDVLKDSDFVVLSFCRDNVKYRGIDGAVSLKYGIRLCSGDTIGPAGIFRAMRDFPVVLECAKDIEALCPDAWVINYVNPTATNGIGLKKYAPKLKSLALCDSQHLPHIKMLYARRAGIIDRLEDYTEEISENFDFRIAGVNHFTWLIRAEYKGKDMSPVIAEYLQKNPEVDSKEVGGDTGAKAKDNNIISYNLYRIFGCIPTCTAHTKEYVRFWQGHGKAAEEIAPLSIWETEDRYRRQEAMWDQVDGYATGKIPIGSYMTSFKPDHATDIIENMVAGLGKPFYINTFNRSAVTNMDDDAFLELCCNVDMDCVTPYPVGEMPKGLRGMCRLILDVHELAAEAIAERSLGKIRRAMLTDPLVNSIGDADNIIKELFEREREMLPKWWY